MSGGGPVTKKERGQKEKNPMRDVRVEKVVLNIGCGGRVPIDMAKTLLERLTKAKIVMTKSKKRTTFANAPGRGKPIGMKVTIRPKRGAGDMIKRLLAAREGKLPVSSFDEQGNVNFGVKEYLDIPGMEYDPKMKMIGMDVAVTLERPGFRTKRKSLASAIGNRHLVTRQAAQDFMRSRFGVTIVEKGEA